MDLGRIWVCFDICCVKLHVILATDQLVHTRGEYLIQSDFNTTLFVSKRLGGQKFLNQDENFKDCIENAGLIERRFDRCLGNVHWMDEMGIIECEAMPVGISNHSPLIIRMQSAINRRNIPFRFFNICVSHMMGLQEECGKWKGGKMLCLNYGVRELKKLNRREFFDISRRVDNYGSDHMNPILSDEERAMMSYFRNLLKPEEEFYKQKSMLIWANKEISTPKFFHNAMKIRRNDDIIEDQDAIKQAMVPTRRHADETESLILCEEVSDEEIKMTLWSIGNDKTSGMDRYNRRDVVNAFNVTTLTIISRVENPSSLGDYRPITYCTVIYKVIKCWLED
ncbi:hypothetical protein MANES_03G089016v8 [Manihot esculenta]|uniref:Uncharacterized protein n=1 Tax=Manihot esculenta TaxID=3983 RepID=A0ACB7HYL8_MANES|nr:hypothetical protein MANES_03G089016v8 [Manihot esculenta]